MPENLEPLRLTARAALGSCAFDLRTASGRLLPTDVRSSLHLTRVAARVNDALDRGLLGLRRGPASPEAPDPWLMAAARLHDAVSDAAEVLFNELIEAEEGRRIVTPPDDALVRPDDGKLFGFVPTNKAYDGWTSPEDASDLRHLALPVKWPAWDRRNDIVVAVNAWGREHQAAVGASGVAVLRDCCSELHQVKVAIREAVRGVRPGTVAASRAVARIAARSLIEMGEDPTDLPKAVCDYVEILGPHEPSALAWHAVLGLLVTMP